MTLNFGVNILNLMRFINTDNRNIRYNRLLAHAGLCFHAK